MRVSRIRSTLFIPYPVRHARGFLAGIQDTVVTGGSVEKQASKDHSYAADSWWENVVRRSINAQAVYGFSTSRVFDPPKRAGMTSLGVVRKKSGCSNEYRIEIKRASGEAVAKKTTSAGKLYGFSRRYEGLLRRIPLGPLKARGNDRPW